jgi:hypothetical protein
MAVSECNLQARTCIIRLTEYSSTHRNAPKSWLRGSMRSAQRNIEGVRTLRLLTPDVASEDNETSTALHFLDESSRKRKGLVPSWINVEHMSQSFVVDPYWNSVCKLPKDSEKRHLESRLPPAKSTLSLQQLYGVMCKEKLFPLKSPSGVEMMLGMQDALSEDFIFAVSISYVYYNGMKLTLFLFTFSCYRKKINFSLQTCPRVTLYHPSMVLFFVLEKLVFRQKQKSQRKTQRRACEYLSLITMVETSLLIASLAVLSCPILY